MRQRLVVPAALVLLLTGCGAQEASEPRAAATSSAASPAAPTSAASPAASPSGTPSASPSVAASSAPAPPPPPPTSKPQSPRPPQPQSPRPPQPKPKAPPPQRSAPPAAPFPADRSPDTATPDGARLSVVDLRFGRHRGYDRVVVELAGDGRPGWFSQYRDVPRHQGRGNRVDIDGQTVLEVSVTGVRYPNERGAEPYEGPEVLRPGSSGVVVEVLRGSVYEGHQQVFIGIDAPEQPFRVFRLPDPPRVVVDIQHPR